MQHTPDLPRWDLTSIFSGLDAPELSDAMAALADGIDGLSALFEGYGVGVAIEPPNETPIAAFEDVTTAYNELLAISWRLEAYCYAQIATDAGKAVAQARWSEYERQAIRLESLRARYSAWLSTLDLNELIARSPVAAAHAGPLRFLADTARHQMSPAEESLAAELHTSGAAGWSRLYERVWSGLLIEVELDGKQQALPMSRVNRLAFDANRETRKRAYDAELRAWQSVAIPLAAALNGVKGQMLTLTDRRGWSSPLDEACATNRIDHETLNVMLDVARESLPDFRRYLRAKAVALGLDRLAWYDLLAPVGEDRQIWDYDTARQLILRAFGSYSAELSGLAERAFEERWLDVEPRPGKRGGAFCSAVGDGTSRIMTNFVPGLGEVRTLAHELGHAYHYYVMHREGRTQLQQMLTPMTLGETASTFCETLVRQSALARATPAEQVTMLDAALQNHCRFIVDVTSSMLFEQRVFETRREREPSVGELNALMVNAQSEVYEDAIDPATFHPFMWAYRPHQFSPTNAYIGFSYMFGLLFGLGLYARYREDASQFRATFDDLLACTGEDDPAPLAARFDIDIRSSDFWRSSLALIRDDIDRFEQNVAE